MNTKFWINDPAILLKKEKMFDFWPRNNLSLAEKLNAVTRSIILLTTLGYMSTRSFNIIVSGIITLVVIVALFKTKSKKKGIKEQFKNLNVSELKKHLTNPTKDNPYMNFSLTDWTDNPEKPPALPLFKDEVKEAVDEAIKGNLDPRLFKDLGDLVDYDNFSRNFHTMPNTTNPNAQMDFAKFCYGNMKSCKEDAIECYKNNDKCPDDINNYLCKSAYEPKDDKKKI